MKILGYALFLFIYFAAFFTKAGGDFFKESLKLAPEITTLVAIFYNYNVFLTFLLTLYPKAVPAKNRANFYNVHIKMSCSVMVSLGLVGTFLGLVDMISGIGAALSGGETDFAKRMATLLEAISTSLGAMAFAFMTSILGVGLSAYSIVAATFIGSALVAQKKEKEEEDKADEAWSTLQAEIEKEEKAKQLAIEEAQARAAEMVPIVTTIVENTFLPISERLVAMEERQNKLIEHLMSDNPFKKRLEDIENKMASFDLSAIESRLTPLRLVEALSEQQHIFAGHNEQIASGLHELSSYHHEMLEKISRVTTAIEGQSHESMSQTEAIINLRNQIENNNESLGSLGSSLSGASEKIKDITDKVKNLFN